MDKWNWNLKKYQGKHATSVTLTKLADKTYVEIISTDFLVWLVAESNFEQSYIEKK